MGRDTGIYYNAGTAKCRKYEYLHTGRRTNFPEGIQFFENSRNNKGNASDGDKIHKRKKNMAATVQRKRHIDQQYFEKMEKRHDIKTSMNKHGLRYIEQFISELYKYNLT